MASWNWREAGAKHLAYALIVLAVLTGFGYVYAFGVNLFWWDDWGIAAPLYDQYAAGTLTAASFWEPHNEHRIVFPKLVMLGLGVLTKGNALASMYFVEVLMLVILAVFLVVARKQFARGPAIWLMTPVAFLVFSLRQYEDMLWAFGIPFFMVVAGAMVAFLALSRVRSDRCALAFVCAILAATVGTYSSLQGLMIWPAGLGQLAIMPLKNRVKLVLATLWTLLGAGQWLAYFHNWTKSGLHPTFGFSWGYLPTLVGGSLSSNPTIALVVGIIILGLALAAVVLVMKRRQWGEQSFWLATMAFSLATMVAITLGRSQFGDNQALASRYTTFSIPLVVATYAIFASQSLGSSFFGVNNRLDKLLLCATLVLMVVGVARSFDQGIEVGRKEREHREYQQFVICTLDSHPDNMVWVGPGDRFIEVIRSDTALLKKLKYHVFADSELYERSQLPETSLPVLPATTQCEVTSAFWYGIRAPVLILGWAVDWPAGDVAGGVAVVIDGVAYPACYGLRSDEAVKKLQNDKYLYSGFKCYVSEKVIKPGKHTVSLKVMARDRKSVFMVPTKSEFETNTRP